LPTQYKDFQTRKYQLKPRLPKTWLRKKDAWNSLISALEAVRDGYESEAAAYESCRVANALLHAPAFNPAIHRIALGTGCGRTHGEDGSGKTLNHARNSGCLGQPKVSMDTLYRARRLALLSPWNRYGFPCTSKVAAQKNGHSCLRETI
jgi:hypothetical protein